MSKNRGYIAISQPKMSKRDFDAVAGLLILLIVTGCLVTAALMRPYFF